MPEYCYKDPKTSETMRLTMSMTEVSERQKGETIEEDGRVWRRDYRAESKDCTSICKGYPFYSEALGTHPDQIKGLQKDLQGLGCGSVGFSPDGAMKIENNAQRRKILKAMGKQDKYGYD